MRTLVKSVNSSQKKKKKKGKKYGKTVSYRIQTVIISVKSQLGIFFTVARLFTYHNRGALLTGKKKGRSTKMGFYANSCTKVEKPIRTRHERNANRAH